MKRHKAILLTALAATILCVLVLCFVKSPWHKDSVPVVDFGRSDEPILFEGDNSPLYGRILGIDCQAYPGIMVELSSTDPAHSYAMTATEYSNYTPVTEAVSEEAVVVERRERDGWVLCRSYSYEQWAQGVARRFGIVAAFDSPLRCKVELPIFSPGDYRITLNFREADLDTDRKVVCTKGELRSVSFRYTVDELPICDSLGVVGSAFVNSESSATITIVACSAQKEAPYQDSSSVRLYPVGADGKAGSTPVFSTEELEPLYLRYTFLEQDGQRNVATYQAVLDGIDTTQSYLLTMRFCENSDGSGEKYDIALRLHGAE